MHHTTLRLAGALALAGGLAACSADTTGTGGAGDTGKVAFGLATRGSVTAQASVGGPSFDAGQLQIQRDSTLITVTSVQFVARKIELETQGSTCHDSIVAREHDSLTVGIGGDRHGDHSGSDDGCGVIAAGPQLVDLPLGAGAQITLDASVPAGTYDRVHIQIHRATDDQGDAAFLQAHPDWANTSIRVTGTIQRGSAAAVPFTFNSRMTLSPELALTPPVTVDAASTTNVTLLVDVSGWFVDASGNALVNPIGPAGLKAIEDNIKASFKAFRDDDHDGNDDHGGSHGGGQDDGAAHT